MNSITNAVYAATDSDGPAIEHLLDLAFGLDRHAKTSYRLREGNQAIKGLSFITRDGQLGISGSISFWPLKIGREGRDALLLGPLAVHPGRQNRGVGLALMTLGLEKAKAMGHGLVILVGDEPYYARVGFKTAPADHFILPGPVDPKRLLYRELEPGTLAGAHGLVLSPQVFAQSSAAFAVPHAAKGKKHHAEAYQACK
ncbi:N-acetyltransferase [soil metagenome]